MTKQDYELIASNYNDTITSLNRYARLSFNTKQEQNKLDSTLDWVIQNARKLAMKIEQNDKDFNRLEFLTACGLTDEQLKRYSEVNR